VGDQWGCTRAKIGTKAVFGEFFLEQIYALRMDCCFGKRKSCLLLMTTCLQRQRLSACVRRCFESVREDLLLSGLVMWAMVMVMGRRQRYKE
jgi:hypothetical protein